MLLREECGGTHSLYSHIIIKLTKSLAMCKNFYKGKLKKNPREGQCDFQLNESSLFSK